MDKCKVFLRKKLSGQKIHQDMFVPTSVCKDKTLEAGLACKITNLGFPEGSIKQYRCPPNVHIRKYPGFYLAHKDCIQPDGIENGVKHLIDDVFWGKCVTSKKPVKKIKRAFRL